jgi:hypothetical protein
MGLSNHCFSFITPKAFVSFSPGQRPGLEDQKLIVNTEGVRERRSSLTVSPRELFQSSKTNLAFVTQGVALG